MKRQILPGFGLVSAVSVLVAQPVWAQVAQVTSVQLKPTNQGLEVILQTTGTFAEVLTSSSGQSLITDIPNAQLRLPEGQAFRQDNPTPNIASVTVTNQSPNQIRVTVTGKTGVPKAEVLQGPQGLILSLTTPPAPATQPTPAPTAPPADPAPEPLLPQPNQETETPVLEDEMEEPATQAEGEEPIDLVITATRTAENLEQVSRSVTVVNRDQIEEQTNISRNLGDILGQLVPGLAPPTQSLSEFGQSLRGRNPLVLIDGVPQSSNRNAFRNIETIDPDVVERIEVLRGPTAIYGDGATGGIINIITRSGEDEPDRFTVDGGLTGSLSHFDDSLGGNIQLLRTGQSGKFDYILSGSFEKVGGLFDAEGDRIPPDLLSSQGSLADTNTLNLFGKVGWEFDPGRLQLTINHFDTDQNTDFTTDPAVNELPPGSQKALARSGLQLEDQSAITNTLVNLDYTHPNLLFGSRVDAQIYYRDYFTRFFPFDGSPFNLLTPEGFRIFQSRVESQRLGGRLQIDTPLVEDKLTLLSGLDYSDESAVQPVTIFDNAAFDASNGLVFNPIADRPWVPPLDQTNLGLFAQLQWQPVEQLVLRGGARHERIGVNVDDFTTLDGNAIPGAELDYDATLFNLGAVYNLTDAVNVYADFSQGFSVADVGLVLRSAPAGFSVTSLRPEAQRVNNYEIGVRGQWDTVQASLAGFYNQSNLGSTFDRETLAIVRAPERIYGLEVAVDVQPTERWRVGTTLSLIEGENDVDEDDNFEALNGFRIPPLKLTAYVENETLPGWQNRLQLLYSGNRDRAFDAGVDSQDVDDYFTLDLISSLTLGGGTLQLGIQNLLNNQYFTPASQLLRLRTNDSFTAASGRTFSLQYSMDF